MTYNAKAIDPDSLEAAWLRLGEPGHRMFETEERVRRDVSRICGHFDKLFSEPVMIDGKKVHLTRIGLDAVKRHFGFKDSQFKEFFTSGIVQAFMCGFEDGEVLDRDGGRKFIPNAYVNESESLHFADCADELGYEEVRH